MSETAFNATHTVPAGGLDARPQADPDLAPVARLDPGLEVEVLRSWGAWAEIACSNGWKAWVDARLLADLAAPPPPAPPPMTAQAPPASSPPTARAFPPASAPPALPPPGRPPSQVHDTARSAPASPGAPGAHATSGASAVPMPALIGAAIALVGALLPWIRGVAGLNAFDVPIQFLVDYKTSGRSSVNVGMFLVAASIAAAVLAIQPGKEAWMRACGWGCVLLGVAHMAQLYRLADNYGGMGFPKVIGAGVYLTVAGGLVVALSPRASR